MSVNQVLHAVDEIINGTPKYTITPNGDGTNGIELANEVVQEGMALNKLCLDKIDNVLSYLTPSVEKKLVTITNSYTSDEDYKGTITTSFSQGQALSSFNGAFQSIGNEFTVTPTFELKSDVNLYLANNSSETSRLNIFAYSGGNKYTTADFNNVFSKSTSSSSPTIQMYLNGNKLYGTFDFGCLVKTTFKFGFGSGIYETTTCKIYVSNDGTNWELLQTETATSQQDKDMSIYINSKRYIKFEMSDDGASGRASTIYYCYFDGIDELSKDIFQNQFTLDNNPQSGFVNNQRVLVETPIVDMTNVTSNILNGIDTPTILQPSTKYELIYKEDTNKFELGGAKVLLDVTLTEAVNQVDLTGIVNKLERNKLYLCNVDGTANTSSQFIGLFKGFMYTNHSSSIALLTYDGVYTRYIWANNNAVSADQSVTTNESISFSTSNYTFNVGTRIVIKEVC